MSIIVDAKQLSVDTDIDLSKGDKIKLSASGEVSYGPKEMLGPGGKMKDGQPDLSLSSKALFSKFPVGALVGWIAEPDNAFPKGYADNAFLVTTEKQEVEAKTAGRLYFAVNDWGGQHGNNTGQFTVTIAEEQSHKIIVYQHFGYGGTHREYISAASSLEALDNHVSSVKVEQGKWELFAEPNFRGKSWVLEPGEYSTSAEMGVPNDQISSLKPK